MKPLAPTDLPNIKHNKTLSEINIKSATERTIYLSFYHQYIMFGFQYIISKHKMQNKEVNIPKTTKQA